MTNHDITLHPDEALNGNLEDCARLLFPQKGESKPRLRFRGFEGEWSRKMIGTIGMTYSGLSGKGKNDFGHGDAKYITFLNVLNNVQIDCSRFEKVEIREGENQNKVHKGDLLFNTSSETPEEVAMCAVMGEEFDNLYLNSFCFGFRLVVPDVDPLFLAYQMRSPYGRSLMSFIAQGATRYNLPKKEFVKTEIIIPKDIEEQRQIASFLCHLDEQIAVKQRQLERLKQMKLACFGSLFPDNQSITPPLRFKGFNGEWIMIRFSDMAQRISISGVSDKLPSVEFEDIVSGEGVLNKDISRKNVVKKGVKFEKHDVLFGKLRPYLKNILYADFNGIAVGDFWVLRASEAVDPYFLYILVSTHQFMSVANISSGSKMPRADWNLVSNSNFAIPSSIDEQRSIASFFRNLDGQINSKSQQVEKLKQVKKACLNQFIA